MAKSTRTGFFDAHSLLKPSVLVRMGVVRLRLPFESAIAREEGREHKAYYLFLYSSSLRSCSAHTQRRFHPKDSSKEP